MEQKKPRPTWAKINELEAKVKELQAKLDDQIDGTSMLVQDCDGWRDKFRALVAENQELRAKLNKKHWWNFNKKK